MLRQDLVDDLAVVRPALASASLIQSLTHLLFAGGQVVAYNDQIGISAPCALEVEGAVPGATLLSFLAASKAKEVEVEAGETEATVKAGGARLKIPMLPPDSFLFEMPKPARGGDELPVAGEEFIAALRGCLRSVSPDTSVPDQLGVTLIPRKKAIDMYSINGVSMSRASVPLKGAQPLSRRVVLPSPFCEEVVRLAGGDKKAKLVVADDYALLTTGKGARVFGKLVDVPKPLDFEGQFKEVVPADIADQAVEAPSSLKLALERALIIADPTGERAYSQITIKGGAMSMLTKSGKGEMRDKVTLKGHPDVSVSADPQWIKIGVADGFGKILITDGAVIMTRGTELYLVATR